jgi:hypothetical protein
LGGHGGDAWSARMADALMALVRGQVGFADGTPTKTKSASRSGKPAVVITIDAVTLDAELVGYGVEYIDGGLTDLAALARLCTPHHTYLHALGLWIVKRDGEWVIERADPLKPTPDSSACPQTCRVRIGSCNSCFSLPQSFLEN